MYDEEENQRRIRNAIARSKSVDSSKEVRLRKVVKNRKKTQNCFSKILKLFFMLDKLTLLYFFFILLINSFFMSFSTPSIHSLRQSPYRNLQSTYTF